MSKASVPARPRSIWTDRDGSFLVIGHRGAAGLVPENTLPSFIYALECGAQAVELDVYLHSDQLVVIHDDSVDRTTNGCGALADMSYAELRALDAGGGAQIPTLEEVLRDCASLAINVELKGPNTAEAVYQCIQRHPEIDFLVSSFNHDELTHFRGLDDATPVAPLFGRWSPRAVAIAHALHAVAINISARSATPARIRAIHEAGFRVYVYTVNDSATAERLRAPRSNGSEGEGADGVFTDYPNRLIPL